MIAFDGVRLLGYDHNHIYLGDNFQYATRKSLIIEGSIYNLNNTEGVETIWSGISGLVGSATDYNTVVINNINFGPARVEKIDFKQGTDVNRKDYTATLTVYESGNLFNLTGTYYNGLNLNNPDAPIFLTQSFSENFTFTLNEANEGEFEQVIDVKFLSGAATGSSANPIKMAQTFASGLFAASCVGYLIGSEYSGYYDPNRKSFFTENYNEITNECSFTCKSKLLNTSDVYFVNYGHIIETNEQGITTVTENGDILGLYFPLSGSAATGFADCMTGAFNRCSGMFSYYTPASYYPLSTMRISLTQKVNTFDGTINYSIKYSNNPDLQTTYIWDYSEQIDKLDNCIYNVTEKGTIKGASINCDSADLLSYALAGYSIVKSGMAGRISGFYDSGTNQIKPLSLISTSNSQSVLNGLIEYSATYTDNAYANVSGFNLIEYSVEDSMPVPMVSTFVIPGVSEMIQPSYNVTVGNRTFKLKINGNVDQNINDYIPFARNLTNEFIPLGGDVFVKDCNYSFQPTDYIFEIQTQWSFFDTVSYEEIFIP